MDIKTFMSRRWLKEDTSDQIKNNIRRLIGILCILCIPIPLIGLFIMLFGVILIAPDIAELIARPFGNFFWSNRQGQRKPVYSRAEALRFRGNYSEAESAYTEIIEEFPQELKAHAARLRIVMVDIGDLARAKEIYDESLETLQNEAARDQIKQLYQSYLKNTGRYVK